MTTRNKHIVLFLYSYSISHKMYIYLASVNSYANRRNEDVNKHICLDLSCSTSVANPRRGQGRAPPQSKFLNFHAVFGKNFAKQEKADCCNEADYGQNDRRLSKHDLPLRSVIRGWRTPFGSWRLLGNPRY